MIFLSLSHSLKLHMIVLKADGEALLDFVSNEQKLQTLYIFKEEILRSLKIKVANFKDLT